MKGEVKGLAVEELDIDSNSKYAFPKDEQFIWSGNNAQKLLRDHDLDFDEARPRAFSF